jgi:hypothetical protein
MVTFNWKIISMKSRSRGEVNNVAYMVEFLCTASNGETSKYNTGHLLLNDPRPSATFIPFEDLTEAQVLVWVKAGINSERVEEELKAIVDNAASAPINATHLPWAS